MPSVKLRVRVTTRASRDQVCGWSGRQLSVRVTTAPVKGAANEATIKLLAKTLKVPARDISIVSGHSSRNKVLTISGYSARQLRQRLLEATDT